LSPETPEPEKSSLGRYAAALVFVAIGAAAFAVVFREAINVVFTGLYRSKDVLSAFEKLPWFLRLVIPALGGAGAGAVSLLTSRLKGGQGVGDVMEAVVLGRTRISLGRAASKAVGSWFAIVSGGSIGREGPIIQFGGGLGGVAGRLFRLRLDHTRALVAAGTAAGFAAAYNTPLAAVLFVVEIVTGVVALETILPAIVATPIATALTRLVIGGGPIYGQRSFATNSELDLLGYAALGLAAGFVGPAFMEMLDRGGALFARLRWPKPLCAALGGLVVGAIAIELPQVTGNGYEAINLILSGKVGAALVVVLLVAKAVATTASVSSGSPGGVFTPSLFLGAALGGGVGHAISLFGSPGSPATVGAYALVGMAALIAATTHAPLLGAVMVFELSQDYAIVLPLLIATATATLVSRRIHPNSIYMEELRRRGLGWEITLEGRKMSASPTDENRSQQNSS
jgi:CIC family chloride channel protein